MLDRQMITWLRNVEFALKVPEGASGVLLATGVVEERDVALFYKMPPVEFVGYLVGVWAVADKKTVREFIEAAGRVSVLVPQSYEVGEV